MERGGCVSHREILELHQDQNFAMIRVELRQDGVERPVRLPALGFLAGHLCGSKVDGQDLGEPFHPLRMTDLRSAMVFRHTQRDPVEPGLDRRASLELPGSTVRDEKDVLYRIFDARLGNAQPS